jgi:hypothetical protein
VWWQARLKRAVEQRDTAPEQVDVLDGKVAETREESRDMEVREATEPQRVTRAIGRT